MMATRSRFASPFRSVFMISLVLILSALATAQTISILPAQEQIVFNRGGDIWIMNTDGSNQRPLVGGIANAKFSMTWEPGNKRIAFTRNGELNIKYPEGGGGMHQIYDMFYAYPDSMNNFWMGFTETFGAMGPDWCANGSKIAFTYDRNALIANSTMPDYQVGFYDTKTRVVSHLELPKGDNPLMGRTPSLSPDGSKVAFVLCDFRDGRVMPIGIVVTSATKVTQTAEELVSQAKKLSVGTAPSWSPDGKSIAYVSTDLTSQAICVMNADLTGKREVYKAAGGIFLPGSSPSWSPDSRKLAFATGSDRAGNGAIYTVNVDGTGATMISGPGSDQFPAWSR